MRLGGTATSPRAGEQHVEENWQRDDGVGSIIGGHIRVVLEYLDSVERIVLLKAYL